MKKLLLFTFLQTSLVCFSQASLVKDINPGFGDGIGNEIKPLNNNVYFAGDDGANGFSLWYSNGSSSNTNQSLLGSNPIKFPHNFYYWIAQNKLVFSAEVGTQGYELWGVGSAFSDYNTMGSSDPSDIGEFQGYLVFAATSTSNGRDLAYAFQSSSVTEVEDINPGAGSSDPSGFTTLGNKFFFSADDGVNGRELWSSISIAPNLPELLIDIYPGNLSSNPTGYTVFNNRLYFTADNGTNGRELWVTDGTVSGTQMILDLYLGSVGSNPTNLTVFNNALYFTATHASLGNEIFKMTPSGTITNLKNINAGSASSYPFNLFVFNNELYFVADDGNGVELWKSGGFPANTNKLKDINPTGESTPQNFCEYNGKLYFNADDGVNGRELWVTDGTSSGTVLVSDINSGALDSNPVNLVVANNILFFSANDGMHGRELWKYQDPALAANDFELAENSIKMYPNPTKSYFEIATELNVEKVEMYTLQGQLVKSFTNKHKYDINDLAKGMYLLKINAQEGIVSKTLIKN